MKRLAEEARRPVPALLSEDRPDLDITGAGSFHIGAIAAHYHVDGRSTPGRRADGRNKFLVGYECTVYSDAPLGHLTVYVYHPEQRITTGTSLPHRRGPAQRVGAG